MLLQNCEAVPTDTLGLLDQIITSADYDEFTKYIKRIYFTSKRNRSVPASSFTGYLNTAEPEHRTLYRARKSKADTDSGFYAGDPRDRNGDQGNQGEDGNDHDNSGVGDGEGRSLGSGRGNERRGSRGGLDRRRGLQKHGATTVTLKTTLRATVGTDNIRYVNIGRLRRAEGLAVY